MTAVALFAILAILAGAVSIFAGNDWVRAGAYAAALVLVEAAIWFSLGLARPVLQVPEGTVLAYSLDEPRAIYLWLNVQGTREPLSVRLAWQESSAAELTDAMRQVQKTGGRVQAKASGGGTGSMDEVAHFRVIPMPQLPPKTPK